MVRYSYLNTLPHLLILVLFTNLSLQVNITLYGIWGHGEPVDPGYHERMNVILTCTAIPPGTCCQGPQDRWASEATNITFEHLTFLDIAAVWEATRTADDRWIQGCSGRVRATRNGPGTWKWDDGFNDHDYGMSPAFGASYITLPATAPFGAATISALLIQGILGLAWVRISGMLDLF